MQANNLTISIPSVEGKPSCDKNCPYCISNMTTSVEYNKTLFNRNLQKVLNLCKGAQVTSVMFTGKGEPTLNFSFLCCIAPKFSNLPLELQTNGKFLNRNISKVKFLYEAGFDTIAISMDSLTDFGLMTCLINEIHRYHMTVRVCLNITDKIPYNTKSKANNTDFETIFKIAKKAHVDQLLIRNVMVPLITSDTPTCNASIKWIVQHVNPKQYDNLWTDFAHTVNLDDALCRRLPHGINVYTVDGMDITFSDYCVQEHNDTQDIRSLIFLEDGHMYTSWDKVPGSRLF